jgi:uncharacterized protein YkwD
MISTRILTGGYGMNKWVLSAIILLTLLLSACASSTQETYAPQPDATYAQTSAASPPATAADAATAGIIPTVETTVIATAEQTAAVIITTPPATVSATVRVTAPVTTPAAPVAVTTPVEIPKPNPGNGVFQYAVAREVLDLVNAERAAAGVAQVKWSDNFAATAKIRSTELPHYFEADHKRPDGREWHTTITEAQIRYRTVGENIARGGSSRDGAAWYTAQVVMESWMDSPGHRANILNPSFEVLGVGVFDLGDRRYYTQHFGTYR